MWIGRLRRALGELKGERDRAASDEEIAGFELTRSARAFSRRAREAADDKLAFSATLMRAGEVGAANSLIDDLEQDVRAQQVALVERVNEVKLAAARRRAKVTRLRLARTLAAALVSAVLLTFSVAGLGLASFLSDLGRAPGEGTPARGYNDASSKGKPAEHNEIRTLRLPDGSTVKLTREQLRAFKSLAGRRGLDPDELERLLIDLVGPRLAGRLVDAIAGVTGVTAGASGELGAAAHDLGPHVGELDSRAGEPAARTGDASPPSPSSGAQKPVEEGHDQPDKPGEGDIIDAPLEGTKPPKPDPALPGGS
ncbi:MAG: hypothetical protein ACRDJL_10915 [Actinomycetota bacterium]